MGLREKKIRVEMTVGELEHVFNGLSGLLSGELSLVLKGNDKEEIKEIKKRVFDRLFKEFN